MGNVNKRRREDSFLDQPNHNGNVWPQQCCPAFTPRGGCTLEECWYCVFADFHLNSPKALEVGICYWPKKV